MKMRAALDVVKEAYEAYGRGDLPALLDLIAEKTDWKFIGPASLPYAGLRTNRKEVADFFDALARADQTDVFEPREFIESGEHVTVLGWTKVTARDTQKTFDSEWVQVITVQDGKITR
jgi:uncharacterized protein